MTPEEWAGLRIGDCLMDDDGTTGTVSTRQVTPIGLTQQVNVDWGMGVSGNFDYSVGQRMTLLRLTFPDRSDPEEVERWLASDEPGDR